MSDDNEHRCKHCQAKPFLPGPHHDSDCPRHTYDSTAAVDDAYEFKCTHCGVKPYTPGSHHESDCPRYRRMYIPSVDRSSPRIVEAPPWMHDPSHPLYYQNRVP